MNALWWWIDRWRKSTAYTDLTLEEQGAYRNLLDEATLRGGAIPNDERILAKACGDALSWKKVRPRVILRFNLTHEGWRNETLDDVLSESNRRSEKQRRYRNGDGNAAGNGSGNAHSNESVAVAGNNQRPPDPISGSDLRSPDPISVTPLVEPPRYDLYFENFKTEYPGHRRVGNYMTQQRFVDACQQIGFPAVLAKLKEQKQSAEWRKGLIPSMQKWFEDKHYERDVAPEPEGVNRSTASVLAALSTEERYD